MTDYTFPNELVHPQQALYFDDEDLEIERLKANAGREPNIAAMMFLLPICFTAVALDRTVFRFFRLVKIAYSHVLTGTKVETPMKWSEI